MLVVPQASETSEAQLPEYSCRLAVGIFIPNELSVMVGFTDWAENLYQTSEVTPAEQPAGILADRVEPTKFPRVLEQVVPEVSVTAPEQSLLAGAGSVTQILNVPFVVGIAPNPKTRT